MTTRIDQSAPPAFFGKSYADLVQRLRVPCGFGLLVTFGWLSQPRPISMLVGIPVAAGGLLLRGWASGHLAKNRELATTGPYAYIRNPLYLGTCITAAGIILASRSGLLTVIFAVAFVFIYLPAVELEEQHLRTIFPAYAAYASRVRRFLPIAKYPGSNRAFSSSLYRRNQEYKALAGFLIAVGWLLWRTAPL